MTILHSSNPTVLWHKIIHEAEKSCSIALKEDLESYLVFLLMRHTDKPELIKRIIATDFMEGLALSHARKEVALQGVGDTCLLLAGLYPKIAEKRLVKISYFVNLGQAAYIAISKTSNDLYELLARQFVLLMDILQSIYQPPLHLQPLEAYDLWNDTGSKRALALLREYTKGNPHFLK